MVFSTDTVRSAVSGGLEMNDVEYVLALVEGAPKLGDAVLLHVLYVFLEVLNMVNMDMGVVAPEILEVQRVEIIMKMDMEFRRRARVARQGTMNWILHGIQENTESWDIESVAEFQGEQIVHAGWKLE